MNFYHTVTTMILDHSVTMALDRIFATMTFDHTVAFVIRFGCPVDVIACNLA
jgi:hypothetical protein